MKYFYVMILALLPINSYVFFSSLETEDIGWGIVSGTAIVSTILTIIGEILKEDKK